MLFSLFVFPQFTRTVFPRKMIFQRIYFLFFLRGFLLGAAALTACRDAKDKPVTAAAGPQSIKAEVYVVKDTSIREEVRLVGSVVANEEVQIVSEQARRLVRVNFPDGATVRKGQLLFKLDDADLRAQLKKLTAQRKLSSGEEFRSASLLKLEGISKQEYERVASSIEVLDAEIEAVRVQLDKTEIRAPFNGKTGIRRVSEGAFVQPNLPLVTLEDINRVKIEFAVPEKYASRVRPGQEINFTVENSEETYPARVVVIEPKIDLNTRSLFIQAVADNRAGELVPGASAMIGLNLSAIEHTILIPTRALIPGLESNSVLLVRNGKAEKVRVETGLRTSRSVQVTGGLAFGDTIMTTNILRAKPGIPVQAVANQTKNP
jgi:membrane fusion protein (multidrug efflux system)